MSCADSGGFDDDADPATACVTWTTCQAGTYQTSAPSATADRGCTACTSGTYSDTINATSCKAVTVCIAGQYQKQAPTATSDRVCSDCTAGEYCAGGVAAPVNCEGSVWDSDGNPATACAARTDCTLAQYEVSAGDPVTDRSCAACPVDYAAFEVNAPRCGLWTAGPSFTQVATADSSTCATRADGAGVMCWGQTYPAAGTFLPPTAAMTSIDGGSVHYCGILATGGTKCWGSESSGEISNTPGVSFKAVSAGDHESCGIRADNSLVQCWPYALPVALAAVPFSSISGGAYGTWCGVRSDTSEVVCWGNSSYVKNNVPSGVAFTQVSTGLDVACGVRENDSKVECWGYSGNLTLLSDQPALAFASVSVSDAAACGLRADNGEAVCWGLMADNAAFHTPRGVAFTQLSMSSHQNQGIGDGRRDQACGVRAVDGKVQCWGWNGSGKVEGNQDSNVYAEVVASAVSACALRSDGGLMCWFRDGGPIMTDIPTGTQFTGLGTEGYNESCAIRADNRLLECWGARNPFFAPLDVAFDSISMFYGGGCGVRAADGTLQCWGYSGYGLLSGVPTGIPVKEVGVGQGFGCALRADNDNVMCWGTDSGWGYVSSAPTGVAFSSLSVGIYQACAVRSSDGKVQCWGDIGALGPAPTTVFSSVSVSDRGACGIRASDGQLECWGDPSYGSMPAVAFAPKGIAFDRISVYNEIGCGVRSGSGRLVCWGSFSYNPQFQTP